MKLGPALVVWMLAVLFQIALFIGVVCAVIHFVLKWW